MWSSLATDTLAIQLRVNIAKIDGAGKKNHSVYGRFRMNFYTYFSKLRAICHRYQR